MSLISDFINLWSLRRQGISLTRIFKGVFCLLTKAQEIEHQGKVLLIDPALFSKRMQRIIYSGLYEMHEAKTIRQALKSEDRVLELGAGIGFTAMLCADIVGQENILSYEANPEIAALAVKNHKRNGYAKLKMVNAILTSDKKKIKSGKATFYTHENFYEGSTHYYPAKHKKKLFIKTQSTEQVVKKFKPTTLLIDIEGEEVDFLTGIKDFADIKKIIVEIHVDVLTPKEIGQMEKHLEKHGFLEDKSLINYNTHCYFRVAGK